MKTFKYKTLKGFMRANDIRQFSLLDYLHGTVFSNSHGWIKFSLSRDAQTEFLEGIAGVVWSKPTEERVNRLRYAPEMGILRRLWLNEAGRYTYCAGQDYPSEIRYIQRHL